MKLKLFGRKRELKHSEAREQLSPYIDGQLGADDRARLELHLRSCRGCAAELEAMRATSALLHALPSARLPRDFTLQAAPRRVVATPRSFFALRLASGVAAAAFVAIFTASALLPAVSAPETATTANYQGRQQSPEMLRAPSAASSKTDAATPKRAAPAAPAAPAAAPAAAPLAAQSAATTPDSGVAGGAAPAAAPAPPAASNSAAAAAAPPASSGAGAAAPAATAAPAAPQVMAAPKVQDQAPTAAGAATTASSAEPAPLEAAAPAAAVAVPVATPVSGRPDRGQDAAPVAPAPRDAASTSPASTAGSPAQPTGVGALSADSAGEQARVAQPVASPLAGENSLQSLLTTLQVAVGSLALLLGLAAAAVWWTHKSQH